MYLKFVVFSWSITFFIVLILNVKYLFKVLIYVILGFAYMLMFPTTICFFVYKYFLISCK